MDIDDHEVALSVNGVRYHRRVESRTLLSDFLRHVVGLTGTRVGCEHGVCGACTILVNGDSVRSCLTLAVRARDKAEAQYLQLVKASIDCGSEKSDAGKEGGARQEG